jgi:alginate O-acetyltransferase complex protein AlgI
VTEFWTRWHISLGDFIKRNVFIPLQLNLVRKFGLKWAHWTNSIVLIVSFGLVGIWHRFTLNFFLWGFAMGIVLSIEKYLRDKFPDFFQNTISPIRASARFLGPAYVFIVLTTSNYLVANELIVVQ